MRASVGVQCGAVGCERVLFNISHLFQKAVGLALPKQIGCKTLVSDLTNVIPLSTQPPSEKSVLPLC